jgi:crotonobetaine/carnitine-CoA ligase
MSAARFKADEVRFAELIESLPPGGGVVFGDARTGIDARGDPGIDSPTAARIAMRTSTQELISLARRAAANVYRRGVRPGDRVASMIDNSLPALVAWFGAALAGAEYVPVNTRLRGSTLCHVLEDSAPRMVIADPACAAVIAELATVARDKLIDTRSWLAEVEREPEANAARDGGGCMIHTSGTTGRPKGVQWSSETQAIHATSYASELVRLASGEHSYSCLPLFHVTCMGVTMASLIQGATIHIDARFSASSFWQRLAQTQAVFFPYVGSILSLLLKDAREPPPHRVRAAMGAAAPPAVFKSFEERFGVRLLETWGQTETGSIWLANHDHVVGSIGRSCPRADFRVVPVAGIATGGELQVRPHDRQSMMRGYHGDAAATSAAWTDGWYRTRDLVTADADGNLFFTGRLADCLRRRGENVSAYEVEQAVLKHPDVVEAAVVGVDAELGEQDIALYYVEREHGALQSQVLAAWCREQLGDFMVPRYFCAVPEFPKTETQRIQKGILHDQIRLRGAYDAERKEMMR